MKLHPIETAPKGRRKYPSDEGPLILGVFAEGNLVVYDIVQWKYYAAKHGLLSVNGRFIGSRGKQVFLTHWAKLPIPSKDSA